MLVLKAMIYVTSPQGVLVFEEPESPHIGLQVPGGTIEQGEDPLFAAGRELYEETGLTAEDALQFLGSIDCMLLETDQPDTQLDTQPDTMRRYYYHAHFGKTFPESWEHYEMHACDGNGPILFRLFWLSHEEARHRLAYGMAELLHHVPDMQQ